MPHGARVEAPCTGGRTPPPSPQQARYRTSGITFQPPKSHNIRSLPGTLRIQNACEGVPDDFGGQICQGILVATTTRTHVPHRVPRTFAHRSIVLNTLRLNTHLHPLLIDADYLYELQYLAQHNSNLYPPPIRPQSPLP